MIHREIFERGEARSRSVLEAESLSEVERLPERVVECADEVHADGEQYRVRVDGHTLRPYLKRMEASR